MTVCKLDWAGGQVLRCDSGAACSPSTWRKWVNVAGIKPHFRELDCLAWFHRAERVGNARLNDHKVSGPEQHCFAGLGMGVFHYELRFALNQVNDFLFQFMIVVAADAAFAEFNKRDISDRLVGIVERSQFTLGEQQAFCLQRTGAGRVVHRGQ